MSDGGLTCVCASSEWVDEQMRTSQSSTKRTTKRRSRSKKKKSSKRKRKSRRRSSGPRKGQAVLPEPCNINNTKVGIYGAGSKVHKTEVYGAGYCGFCTVLKRFLKKANVNHEYHDIEKSQAKFDELNERTSQNTIPAVWVSGKPVGGYTEFYNLLKRKYGFKHT